MAALWIPALLVTACAIPSGWSSPADFHETYEAARELRESGRPYLSQGAIPYLNANPPLLLWLLATVTLLPEPAAYAGLVVASLGALAGATLFITRRVPSAGFAPTLALFLLLQSTALALQIGQLSLLMVPMMTAAWWADRTGHRASAGAVLGGLIYWKPFSGSSQWISSGDGSGGRCWRSSRPLPPPLLSAWPPEVPT